MLYTIVPHEVIFADETAPALIDIPRGEAVLRVSVTNDGRAQVSQLISTNPNDYLRPQYMPGSTVSLSAEDLAIWQAASQHKAPGAVHTESIWGEHE